MLWSKLKNVIIALLLLTNLFLLALVLSERVVGDNQELQARQTAITFLQERGILISESVVPREFELESQQMIWDRSGERGYGEALLGTVAEESLGGEIVRYYNGQGELRFHGNGEFYGNFVAEAFPCALENQGSYGAELLKTLGISVQLVEEDLSSQIFIYVQELAGVPLLGCEVILRFEGDYLAEIVQGKRLAGTFQLREEDTLSVATALMQFYQGLQQWGEDCGEILEIRASYIVTTALSSPAYLTPAWNLVTEEGEYFLNGTTGVLE